MLFLLKIDFFCENVTIKYSLLSIDLRKSGLLSLTSLLFSSLLSLKSLSLTRITREPRINNNLELFDSPHDLFDSIFLSSVRLLFDLSVITTCSADHLVINPTRYDFAEVALGVKLRPLCDLIMPYCGLRLITGVPRQHQNSEIKMLPMYVEGLKIFRLSMQWWSYP